MTVMLVFVCFGAFRVQFISGVCLYRIFEWKGRGVVDFVLHRFS